MFMNCGSKLAAALLVAVAWPALAIVENEAAKVPALG